MDNRYYLEGVPENSFEQIIRDRNKAIEAASDEMPKYEYNANLLARDLHPKVQHVKITSIEALNGARCYTLEPDKNKGTDKLAYFRAGQYVSVNLKIGESVLTRPYSLCSSPAEALKGKYKILVKSMKNGFASDYINKVFRVGNSIEISEPSGFFSYEPLRDAETVIGIAGGSGIAPFMSYARALADGTEDFELTLLYGNRTEADILFKDELKECVSRSGGKFKVVHVLSEEDKPGFEKGFITSEIIAKHAPVEYSVFACGPKEMYDFVEDEVINKLKLPLRRVRFDAYGEYGLTDRDKEFSDVYKDKTFDITVITRDGIEHKVPARADETILVALEKSGITAPSKCRSGECGFCRSHLVSGEVYIPDKVDKRRKYDKETGFIHPCCTFPKSDLKILINYEEPKIVRKLKDIKRKQVRMSIVMSIIMSSVMGALASFIILSTTSHAFSQSVMMTYLVNIIVGAMIGTVIAITLPIGKLGKDLASRAGATPPSLKFTLLNALPLSLGNTLIIGLLLSGFGVFMGRHNAPAEVVAQMPPFIIMWLMNYAKLLLPTFLISYFLSVILSPVVSKALGLLGAAAEVGRSSAVKD